MNWLALKMLLGSRAKYAAMLFGTAFASLLICQQCAIFCGVMRMTTGQIRDVEPGAAHLLWVLSPRVRYIEDLDPLPEWQVERVRSVSGVAWAVPLQKGYGRIHLPGGHFQQVILMALDDATLVGAPRTLLHGSLDDLQRPDAVVVDEVGHQLLWPDEPFQSGRVVTLNGRRAEVVGLCRASLTFQTLPILYTRRSQSAHYLPPEGRTVSAILAQVKEGEKPAEVCARVHQQTGLLALTSEQFVWRTMGHYLRRTGLLANFGTTVLLGLLVGVAIAGQNFYSFTLEHLPQFGMLKAMGVSNRRLAGMVLLQASLVATLGYALGIGAAALFGELTRGHSKLVFFMPWQVPLLTGLAIFLVTLGASLLSLRQVLRLELQVVVR